MEQRDPDALEQSELDAILDGDALRPPSSEFAYPPTADEVAKAFGFLGVPPSPHAHLELHAAIAVFIAMGIEGNALDQVRNAFALASQGDPSGYRGAAGALVKPVVMYRIEKPTPGDPEDALRYTREIAKQASGFAKAFRRRAGRPRNAALDALLSGLILVATNAGADISIGSNDKIADEVPPFVAFVEEILLAACERAGRVLRERPDQPNWGQAVRYFEDMRTLAMGNPRRLADAIRSVRKRDKSRQGD